MIKSYYLSQRFGAAPTPYYIIVRWMRAGR